MSKIFYKATRPSGKDFWTNTVDYAAAMEAGKPLKRLTSDSYEICTGTVYHASDVPAETLVGGSWPCRLFEVTGRPVDSAGHKYGFRSLRVVREIPAWQALGPNGEAVAKLIQRARTLSLDEILRLDAAWGAALDAAWGAALDAARGAARGAALDAAWGAALDAARGAAIAILTQDLISEDEFRVLIGPWSSVITDLEI